MECFRGTGSLSVSHTIGELPSDTQESACCVLLKCRFKMHQKAALNLQGHPNCKYIKSKYKRSEVKPHCKYL